MRIRRLALTGLPLVLFLPLAGDTYSAMPSPQPPDCPLPTTIRSGLGPRDVPFLVLAPSGMAFGSQQGLLVNEFNRRALDLANEYCRPCVADYKDATSANITYKKEVIGGWTELTMVAAGGQPKMLPAGTDKRAGKIDPPSPNVVCRKPPPLPPPAQRPTPSVAPNPVDANTPPADCVQPNFVIPAGTVIAQSSWPVPAGVTGQVPWAAIQTWIQNVYPATRAALLASWANTLQGQCNQLNPGRSCVAVIDLPDDAIEIQQGETGTVFNTSKTIYVWKAVLKTEIRGSCQHQ